MYGLSRSPFYPKMFASCGDWTARVWNEDLRTPLITTAYHTAHLTAIRWSPTRCCPLLADCPGVSKINLGLRLETD